MKCNVLFSLRRKFQCVQDERFRTDDESTMLRKALLTKEQLTTVKKTVDESGVVNVQGDTFQRTVQISKVGKTLWNKYMRLKRIVLNEDTPLWNQLIKKNSGLQMEDMLLLFRQKKFSDAVTKLASKKNLNKTRGQEDGDDEVDDDGNSMDRDVFTKKAIEKHPHLSSFTDDYYPATYFVFKIFGAPAHPFDSPVFRAQLSNGPKKAETTAAPTMSSVSLMMTAADGPSDVSGSSCGGKLSRAELKNKERLEKQVAQDEKHHEDFMRYTEYSAAVEDYQTIVDSREKQVSELEKKIQLYGRLNRDDEARAAEEALLQLLNTPYPVKPAKFVHKKAHSNHSSGGSTEDSTGDLQRKRSRPNIAVRPLVMDTPTSTENGSSYSSSSSQPP